MDSCPLLNAACKLFNLSCNGDSALIQKVSGPLYKPHLNYKPHLGETC